MMLPISPDAQGGQPFSSGTGSPGRMSQTYLGLSTSGRVTICTEVNPANLNSFGECYCFYRDFLVN